MSTNAPVKSVQQAGFSLLELSLIMLLMMLMLGLALPRFTALFKSNLQQEAERIAALLHNLKTDAVFKGENYKITFDTQKSAYRITVASPEDPDQYLLHDKFPKPIQLPAPISLKQVTKTAPDAEGRKFQFDAFEFDKIFGQEFEVKIDSSGLIDLFKVKLVDGDETISVAVVNIMGKIELQKPDEESE